MTTQEETHTHDKNNDWLETKVDFRVRCKHCAVVAFRHRTNKTGVRYDVYGCNYVYHTTRQACKQPAIKVVMRMPHYGGYTVKYSRCVEHAPSMPPADPITDVEV